MKFYCVIYNRGGGVPLDGSMKCEMKYDMGKGIIIQYNSPKSDSSKSDTRSCRTIHFERIFYLLLQCK